MGIVNEISIGLYEEVESECIFPFYYNGRKYEECVLIEEFDFPFLVFRCPIRRITNTTIDGTISFNFSASDLTSGYCIREEDLVPGIQKQEQAELGVPHSKCKLDGLKKNCSSGQMSL